MFSLIVTPVIFKNNTKDAAGAIVGYLFPVYFPFVAIICGLSLLSYLLTLSWPLKRLQTIMLCLLVFAFICSMVNYIVVHPQVKQVKAKIHSFDKSLPDTTAQAELQRKFKQLHKISVLFNLIILIEGMALIVIPQRYG
ncbi:MAG: DUF4149 domain-containing protein [Candidatus Magnetominusculus sp. LBB02]|nr:DUF4149 domain-containing protein [Candidatus Magnetominusculus sp. LBB02]